MQTSAVQIVASSEQHDVKLICVGLGVAYSSFPFYVLLGWREFDQDFARTLEGVEKLLKDFCVRT